MKKNTHLLLIDPQNSFCKPGGELFVSGADADCQRLGPFIKKNVARINTIHCTLDSHQILHIAHPSYWRDSNGNHPNPRTPISAQEVRDGKYMATLPQEQAWALGYVEALERGGRYSLFIWPPHCLIGTPGHNIQSDVLEGLLYWSEKRVSNINFVTKGSQPRTEHYSGVRADVVVDSDESTKLNQRLIAVLQDSSVNEILITGEALSHCVANTITDIANEFGEDNIKKFTLLRDTSSNVTGFEGLGDKFVTDMTTRGMKVTDTVSW